MTARARPVRRAAARRLRNLIVATADRAAMVLMVQIGLFMRTTWKLSDVAPGFDPAQVLTFHVGLPASRYARAAVHRSIHRQSAAATSGAPRRRLRRRDRSSADRRRRADGPAHDRGRLSSHRSRARPARRAVGDRRGSVRRRCAFRFGVAGSMTRAEMSDACAVVLINEEAARRFWPGRDPVGSRLALDSVTGQEAWLEVVGVVGNLRNSDVDQGPLPQVFVSTARQRSHDIAVVVKSAGARSASARTGHSCTGRGDRSESADPRRRVDVAGAVRRSGQHLRACRRFSRPSA